MVGALPKVQVACCSLRAAVLPCILTCPCGQQVLRLSRRPPAAEGACESWDLHTLKVSWHCMCR